MTQKTKSWRMPAGETAVTAVLVVIMLILVAYPLASLVYGSLNVSGPDRSAGGLSAANFARILSDPQFWMAWRNTILVSIGSSVLALVFGLGTAFLISRTDLPYRRICELLVILPIFISPFIGAIAWSGLAAPNVGLLNRVFSGLGLPIHVNIYSLPGIAMVLGFYMTPYVFLFTSGPLTSIDTSMEEASRLSGQGMFQTLMRVTFPLVTPSIFAAALLVFVLSMENFGVLAVLGVPSQIPFIPTEIYLKFSYPPPDYGYATVVSISFVLMTALGLLVQRSFLGRKNYVAISGKSYRPMLISLGRARWVAFGGVLLFVFISTVLPLFTMVMASFQSYWTTKFTAFTFVNYEAVFTRGLFIRAAQNSFLLSFVGAFIACALAGAVAYVVSHTRAPGRAFLDILSSMTVGVPGVVLGVALLWAWIRVPLPIYGTIWILLIAYITRFLSFGIRNMSAALTQVDRDLENAARVSGASKTKAALTITFPLIRGSIVSSWVLYFISFIKELNTSVLLYAFNSVVLPVLIFDAYLEGRYPEVAALGTGISVIVLLTLVLSALVFGVKIKPKA
ncbi:iron ABC transporter permease [Rhizobium sp. P32RR-XVIII]|uniref:ABC transporter permease n=1 Tax=Rhizobium sp. P32RR-XVIII TaxID=2726738 RepID=UPI00145774C6|nr:iron ABC transporter permease [Rhizobium sp. P32RR-XVIII]NLS06179.1 iron ABC transporter permease [Rhizobium sp. P32RR-XVIII]